MSTEMCMFAGNRASGRWRVVDLIGTGLGLDVFFLECSEGGVVKKASVPRDK